MTRHDKTLLKCGLCLKLVAKPRRIFWRQIEQFRKTSAWKVGTPEKIQQRHNETEEIDHVEVPDTYLFLE